MIAALKGKIIFQGPNYLVVAVNDVGYKVFVGTPAAFAIGEEVSLHIHHHVTEASSDLYGFKNFDELEFFGQLLAVSGVGPRTALAIIAQKPHTKIRDSIIASDPSYLQSTSGVGSKLASKIIVELRPKLAKGQADISRLGHQDEDLLQALAKLGWRRQEVASVIQQASKGGLDERLKTALKLLGS